MKPLDRATARKYHQEKIKKLMDTTRVDNDTQFHFLDEATMHIIDHFAPPGGPRFTRDHCLIIGCAHLGDHRDDDRKQVVAGTFFAAGDLHELSHSIALAMHDDKVFAHAMFHALEVFALHKKPTNLADL